MEMVLSNIFQLKLLHLLKCKQATKSCSDLFPPIECALSHKRKSKIPKYIFKQS